MFFTELLRVKWLALELKYRYKKNPKMFMPAYSWSINRQVEESRKARL